MKTAFVILNWNDFELTKKAMESVIEVENEQEKCIIVVDNASNKDVVDKLIGFFENNRWNIIPEDEIGKRQINDNSPILILNKSNYGYAKGNNIGLKLADIPGCKYAVVMNNDVVLKEKVVGKLISIMQKNSEIGVIGPRVIGPNGKPQGPFWKPGIFDYFFVAIFYPILYPFIKLRKLIFRSKLSKEVKRNGYSIVYRIIGCFMLIDLQKMKEVGWFDEKTFLYAEELILAERLLKHGYKTAYTDVVSIFHQHEMSTRYLGAKKIKAGFDSEIYYFKQYRGYGKIRLFLVKFGFLYRVCVKFIVFGLKSFFSQWFNSKKTTNCLCF